MDSHYRAINTLVLVETAQQANDVAAGLRGTAVPVQQSWVNSVGEFSSALRRDHFDLGIIFCTGNDSHIPAAIARYPQIPFLAMLGRYKNRLAENLIERGVADVVGLSQPLRMRRVLERLLSEASLRQDIERLRAQQRQQDCMIHSVLQHTRQAVAYLHQGLHSYANSAYQQLTGLHQLEAVQQTPLLDVIDTDDRQTLTRALKHVENGDQAETTLDIVFRRSDGSGCKTTISLSSSIFDDEPVVQLLVRDTGQRADQALGPADDETGILDATMAVAPVGLARLQTSDLYPINNLRADLRERFMLSDADLVTAERMTDHSAEDRSRLDQAMGWLQQRCTEPGLQLFVRLSATAASHGGLSHWLGRQLQQRELPVKQLALMLPAGSANTAACLTLATELQQLGVTVAASQVESLDAIAPLIEQQVLDYVFVDLALAETAQRIRSTLARCRRDEIKTVASASSPEDIKSVWQSGFDAYIDPHCIGSPGH